MNRKIFIYKIAALMVVIICFNGCSKNYLSEFKKSNNSLEIKYIYKDKKNNTYESAFKNKTAYISNKTILSDAHIDKIYYKKLVKNSYKEEVVILELNEIGKKIIAGISINNNNEILCMLLNGKIHAVMKITEPITNGVLIIGGLTIDEFLSSE